MILTDDEFEELQNMEFSQNDWLWFYTQAVENKLLEKLKAQAPVGVFWHDEDRNEWGVNIIDGTTVFDGDKLYRHPLPPDDVVRDAARYKWLRDETNEMSEIRVINSTWEHLDAAIDAALEKTK